MTPFDQLRINQLLSVYSPETPPSLPLDFGDYLSLLWRLDRAALLGGSLPYYRRCEQSLSNALGITDTALGKLVKTTEPGRVYEELPQLPYRQNGRKVDATDRRHATAQLLSIRADLLALGSYEQGWTTGWPGSRVADEELRERIYAILFAALPSQYEPFSRLLLVVDIVLQELMIGTRRGESFLLHTLVMDYAWPDPGLPETIALYWQGHP